MTRSDVQAIVIATLNDVQRAMGCEPWTIGDGTRPIGDLPKFDSIVSEDVTVIILEKLGAPAETKDPFTMREDGKFLTLDRIVDHFCRAAGISGV